MQISASPTAAATHGTCGRDGCPSGVIASSGSTRMALHAGMKLATSPTRPERTVVGIQPRLRTRRAHI